MARHVFVLLLVAVSLLQTVCGRPVTPEEAHRLLSMERRFLLEAAGLLERWRRLGADHLQLVGEMRQLQARHDQLLAATATWFNWTSEALPETAPSAVTTNQLPITVGTQLNWTSKAQPHAGQNGIATEVTGAMWVGYIPQKMDHPPRKGGEGQEAKHLSAAGGPDWRNEVLYQSAEVGPTAEKVDLLRREAPSAKDLHQLADEFQRVWASHKLRFDDFDTDKDVFD